MNHNHKPKILHHDQYGYVAHCPCCKDFQVGFGNIYIRQTREDLNAFANLIHRYNCKYQHCKKPTVRNIHISSPYEGFGLLLSPLDLERLNHILQKTLLIISADNRVRLQ